MGAEQAPGRLSRFGRYAPTLALSAAGCALIVLALCLPPDSPPPAFVSPARENRPAVSARGGRPAEQRLTALEELASLAEDPAPQTPTSTAEATEISEPTETPAPTATPPRTEVILYRVQPGDNLWLISERFNLNQDTIVWANEEVEKHPDLLSIDQEIHILPVDGVWHTLKAGETLAAIAARYQADAQQIIDYVANGITDPGSLSAGQKLIIPGGVKPAQPRSAPAAPSAAGAASSAPAGGPALMIPAGAPAVPVEAPSQPGRFIWPAQGTITQYYGKWHGAIDIANKQGTPIVAADAGTVTFAAVSGGLGNAVQIDHGDGFATAYGHLHSIAVQVGQSVQKGEQIGLMGSTGRSTGPHLHLIFTYNGGVVNPLDYLPQ